MATLRIEHGITDFRTWQQAFDGFADARAKAGVRGFAIRQPVGDDKYLAIDLEFDTTGQAEAFERFLHGQVWSSSASAPALDGTPTTQIFELVRAEGT